jgi:hypothetical protein
MNIYLDIDGVLLANEYNTASYASEFLEYIIKNYPDSTYWLTTHCKGDASVPVRHIGHLFDQKTVELMRKMKPTYWELSKTEAIDFSQPFLWFDDDLFYAEKQDLIKHDVLENWIEVNLSKDPNMLGKFLNSFPTPIDIIRSE